MTDQGSLGGELDPAPEQDAEPSILDTPHDHSPSTASDPDQQGFQRLQLTNQNPNLPGQQISQGNDSVPSNSTREHTSRTNKKHDIILLFANEDEDVAEDIQKEMEEIVVDGRPIDVQLYNHPKFGGNIIERPAKISKCSLLFLVIQTKNTPKDLGIKFLKNELIAIRTLYEDDDDDNVQALMTEDLPPLDGLARIVAFSWYDMNRRSRKLEQLLKQKRLNEKLRVDTPDSADAQAAKLNSKKQDHASGRECPCYKMDAVPRGKCYIFSNKTFDDPKPNRAGADKDRNALKEVFEKLKFKVVVEPFDDIDSEVMEKKLKEIAKSDDFKKDDCLVIIFLSHGKDGAIMGTDNVRVEIKAMTKLFNAKDCKTLAGKPKLFFFQACRGIDQQTGVRVESDGGEGAVGGKEVEYLLAPEDDFFFGYATVPGYKANRNPEYGSWFIQELVDVLENFADKEDLESMMIRVKAGVSKHTREDEDFKYQKQTAETVSRLLKKLYF